jgi:hypothetical protein
VAPGSFVTRLQRIFAPEDVVERSIFVERAPTDEEFRRGLVQGALPGELVLLALVLAWARSRGGRSHRR